MGELIVCKNCGNQFEGNFCNQCSQPADTKPIDALFIWHDLQHGIFHFNNKIFYTIRQLFTRPGHSIREFVDGKRLKHFQPISFMVVLAGIYAGVFHLLDIDILSDIDDGDTLRADSRFIIEWLLHHFSAVQLISLPIFTLASYLSFKKWGGSIWDYVVINAFITCQRLLLTIFLLPIVYHYSGTSMAGRALNIILLFSALFASWTFIQYFKGLPIRGIILRTLLAYLIGMLGIFILVTITILLYITTK